MNTNNSKADAADVRGLTESEIGTVAGGSWFSRLIWQILNAPENSVLVGCSDDMTTCTWQSN